MARIAGRDPKIWDWLAEAGVVTPGDFTRRVIIDIDVQQAVKVYVEKFGTDHMFTIGPPHDLGGSVISVIDRPPDKPGPPHAEVTAAGDTSKVYVATGE